MTNQRKQANPVTEFLRGKKFQLKGTLFYPYLLAPKEEPNKAPKYSCMIAWDSQENAQVVQQIRALFAQVKQQFHPNMQEHLWTNPLKDYNITRKTNGDQYPKYLAGKLWMNAANNLKFPPQVMVMDQAAPNGMRLATQMDSMQIYDGQQIIVSVSFFGLHGENSKYGVSTNVDAVLVVGGGERIMTEAGGVDVNQAFGAFLGQMGQGQQQVPVNNQQYNQQQAPVNNPQYNAGPLNGQQYHQQAPVNNQQYANAGQMMNGGQQQQDYYQQPNTAYDPRQGQNNQQYNNGGGYNSGNGGGLV